MSPRTAATAADAAAATALRDGRMARRKWLVPWITFFSSLCFALGSGMTVKFFPLFFKNDCAMSPVGVQCIYIAVPVLMALMSGIGTKLSKCLGRAQTMVLLKIVGVALLCSMAYLNTNWLHDGGGEPSSGDGDAPIPMYKVVVVVAIYLLRTGLMNCTFFPLEESILVDFDAEGDARAVEESRLDLAVWVVRLGGARRLARRQVLVRLHLLHHRRRPGRRHRDAVGAHLHRPALRGGGSRRRRRRRRRSSEMCSLVCACVRGTHRSFSAALECVAFSVLYSECSAARTLLYRDAPSR